MLVGCPEGVKITIFRVHMSDSSSTGKRPTFYSTSVLKMDPKITNCGCLFSRFFCYLSGPLFQRFCLPDGPQNGTPKNIFSNVWPCQNVINSSQISLFLILERVPFWGPSLEPLQNTRFVDFDPLLGSIWGPFGLTFSALFLTSFSDPHLDLERNLSWQWNGKRVESCSSDS